MLHHRRNVEITNSHRRSAGKKTENTTTLRTPKHARPVVMSNKSLIDEVNKFDSRIGLTVLDAKQHESRELQVWLIWNEAVAEDNTASKTHRHLIHDFYLKRPDNANSNGETGGKQKKVHMSKDRVEEYFQYTHFPHEPKEVVVKQRKDETILFPDACYEQYDIMLMDPDSSQRAVVVGNLYARLKYNDPGIYVETKTTTIRNNSWDVPNAETETLRYAPAHKRGTIGDQDIETFLKPVDDGWSVMTTTMECKGNVLFSQSYLKSKYDDKIFRFERKACWPLQDPEKLCTNSLIIYNPLDEGKPLSTTESDSRRNRKIKTYHLEVMVLARSITDETFGALLEKMNQFEISEFDHNVKKFDLFCMHGILFSRWLEEKITIGQKEIELHHVGELEDRTKAWQDIVAKTKEIIPMMNIVKIYPPMEDRIMRCLDLATPLQNVLEIMSEIDMHFFMMQAQCDKRNHGKYSLQSEEDQKDRKYASLHSHLKEHPFACDEYRQDVDANAHVWVEALGVGRVCRTEAGALSSITCHQHFFERNAV